VYPGTLKAMNGYGCLRHLEISDMDLDLKLCNEFPDWPFTFGEEEVTKKLQLVYKDTCTEGYHAWLA